MNAGKPPWMSADQYDLYCAVVIVSDAMLKVLRTPHCDQCYDLDRPAWLMLSRILHHLSNQI